MHKYSSIFILIAAFLIPGAYGISLSVSEGDDGSGAGATTTYSAGTEDVIEHNIKLDPQEKEMSNSLYFTGSGGAARYTYGNNGGYAMAGLVISGVQAQTWYDFYVDYSQYAVVSEYFTSVNAANIYGWASAESNAGDVAYTDISVTSPYNSASLYDYSGRSYGSSTEAYAAQSASSASAPYGVISTSAYADNRYGDVSYVVSYNMNNLYSPYPYYSSYPAQAWANGDYSLAGQSLPGKGNPMKVYAQANLASYTPINNYNQVYGSHAVNQLAYTYRPYMTQWAYNTPIY